MADPTYRDLKILGTHTALPASPDDAVLSFLQGSYAAAADNAHWDRAALERAAE